MKPALAENREEKERKDGGEKVNKTIIIFPQRASVEPSSPWEGGCRPPYMRQERSQPRPRWPHMSQGLLWCTKHKPFSEKSILPEAPPFWRHFPWEDKPGAPSAPSFSPPSDHLFSFLAISLIRIIQLWSWNWNAPPVHYWSWLIHALFPAILVSRSPQDFHISV